MFQVAAFNDRKTSALDFIKLAKEAMTAKGPETGLKEREQIAREVGGTIQYIADKISDLMLKSQINDPIKDNLQLSNFEDLRSAAIVQLDKLGDDEENKDIIIDSLVYLKEKLRTYQEGQQMSMQEETPKYKSNNLADVSLPEGQMYDDNNSIDMNNPP